MLGKLLRGIQTMEFEEKILHSGSLLAAISVFLPWFEGKRFCADELCSGFGFLTAYIGFSVFALHVFLIVATLSPLMDGPIIIRKSSRAFARLLLSSSAFLLLLAALSVLVRVFGEDSGATIRFGIYLCMIGSVVSMLYSFLKYQEYQRGQVQELFHHPEHVRTESKVSRTEEELTPPPPPPPPPPSPPEDHHDIFTMKS